MDFFFVLIWAWVGIAKKGLGDLRGFGDWGNKKARWMIVID